MLVIMMLPDNHEGSGYGHEVWPGITLPQAEPSRVAAKWLWICSSVQIVLFTCCISMISMIFVLDPAMIHQISSQVPGGQVDAAMMSAILKGMAVMSAMVMVVPSFICQLLGFKIRKGSRRAAIGALVILGCQGSLLLMVLLISVLPGLFMGAACEAVMNLLLYGGLLILIVKTGYQLLVMLQRSGGDLHHEDPWNRHLPF